MILRSKRQLNYLTEKEEFEALLLRTRKNFEENFRKSNERLEMLKKRKANPELYPKEEESDGEKEVEDKSRFVSMNKKIAYHSKAATEYLRQLEESDGFDIDDAVVPGFNMFKSFLPVCSDHIESLNVPIPRFCEAALDIYNRDNNIDDEKNKFKFPKFAYATYQMTGLITYLLTFHATTDVGDHAVFQAYVVNRKEFGPGKPDVPDVQFCRIKAPPKVNNVRIDGDLVEGNTIKGIGDYVGGGEGASKFEWLRVNIETRMWEPLLSGTNEYILTREDVGHCLVFKYSPVNSVGQEGKCRWITSEEVKQAPPSVKNVRIVGKLVEGNIIKGIGDYVGGKEGPSKYEWLRKNKYTRETESLLTSMTEYTLTKEDVSRRLIFKYTPLNCEGAEGKSRSILSLVVKQGPSSVNNAPTVGEDVELCST